MSDRFDLEAALETAGESVSNAKAKLFPWMDSYVCEACNAHCEPSETYDIRRAAFFEGESPSWYCSSCETHYVREPERGGFPSADLYDR